MQWPDLTEKTLGSERLLDGCFLQVLRDTVELRNGVKSYREYCVHPGAAVVVPLLDDATTDDPLLLLEWQYRYPVRQHLLEFPAGKLDAGEPSLACAQRELQEETGYLAKEWAYAGVTHPCIAYSTEAIHIWFARGLALHATNLDDDEELALVTMRFSELQFHILAGRVTDAKSLACFVFLQSHVHGKLPLEWEPVSQ